MSALFEPDPGTLERLRSEFARRMPTHLRSVLCGSGTRLFDGTVEESNGSLVSLAADLLELKNALRAEEAAIDKVARGFLTAYLQFTHAGSSISPSATELAAALLSACNPEDG